MDDRHLSAPIDEFEKVLKLISAKPSPQEVGLVLRCFVIFFTLYILIIAAKWLIKILLLLSNTFEPMNYEQDMTIDKYCKSLAEIDNSLRIQTMQQQRTVTRIDSLPMQQVDSATKLMLKDSTDSISLIKDLSLLQKLRSDEALAASAQKDEYIYPNGWLPVMESSKVKPGEIKRAIIMGRDIIVTRSSEGKASVLDAYCPHMGVHIGVGGKVLRVDNQSCVQCPFHGWTFRATDGQCVRVPYSKGNSSGKCSNLPKQAKLNAWISDEVDNFIFIWHHIDNQAPTWRLEQTPELQDLNWLLAGRTCHKTYLDLRDMHENGADINHFEGIHNDLFVFGGEYLKVQAYSWFQKYARHHWDPDWKPILDTNGTMTHKAQLSLCSWISLLKFRLFDLSLEATQIGPACVVLKFHSNWYGNGVINMYSIPLGGRKTLYVQHIHVPNRFFCRFMAKWVLYGEIKQLERDLFMWNHKKTLTHPVLLAEDKFVKRFRLWYSQFYKRKRRITIQSFEQDTTTKVNSCMNNNIEF